MQLRFCLMFDTTMYALSSSFLSSLAGECAALYYSSWIVGLFTHNVTEQWRSEVHSKRGSRQSRETGCCVPKSARTVPAYSQAYLLYASLRPGLSQQPCSERVLPGQTSHDESRNCPRIRRVGETWDPAREHTNTQGRRGRNNKFLKLCKYPGNASQSLRSSRSVNPNNRFEFSKAIIRGRLTRFAHLYRRLDDTRPILVSNL